MLCHFDAAVRTDTLCHFLLQEKSRCYSELVPKNCFLIINNGYFVDFFNSLTGLLVSRDWNDTLSAPNYLLN